MPILIMDFSGGAVVKNLPAVQETWIRSLGWEDPLEEEMATHSSSLPGESHGQKSLAGYSPWGDRVRQDWATEQAHAVTINSRKDKRNRGEQV